MKAAVGPGAVYMAGGIDVVNRMKSGLQVTDVIHLGAVAEPPPITWALPPWPRSA